jgi:hypothetical protein
MAWVYASTIDPLILTICKSCFKRSSLLKRGILCVYWKYYLVECTTESHTFSLKVWTGDSQGLMWGYNLSFKSHFVQPQLHLRASPCYRIISTSVWSLFIKCVEYKTKYITTCVPGKRSIMHAFGRLCIWIHHLKLSDCWHFRCSSFIFFSSPVICHFRLCICQINRRFWRTRSTVLKILSWFLW